jgi:MYXO-CTERM domain-containing protein
VRRHVFTTSLALAIAALPSSALANGRLPGPANLRFHPTEDRFLLGATFGLVESTEGGQTNQWVCENAVGYGGEYDPDYAFHPTRDELWSTTFEGLRVTRDGGCTWTTIGAPFAADTWIGEVEIGSDGRVWAATSSGNVANDVYVSTDGETFVSAGLEDPIKWWESIKIAPSDADVIYVTGYQIGNQTKMEPAAGFIKKTTTGGAPWTDLAQDGITFGSDPRMMILGVSPVDADVVFLRVLNAAEPLGDAIYRSTNGGASWEKVLQLAHALRGFAISSDGQTIYAGTAKLCATDEPLLPDGGIRQKGCLYKSTTGGGVDSWSEAGYSPRLGPDNTPSTSNSLAFGPDGALYAGGSNGVDGWLVGKSTDGAASFTAVMKLNDIDGPLECEAETAQAECAALIWPVLCVQNFICPAAADAAPAADAGTGGGGGGCCAVAPTPAQMAGSALLALVVGVLITRRRRST